MTFLTILPMAFVMIAGPQIITSFFLATSPGWAKSSLAYVTGAAISPDGSVILLRTFGGALAFKRVRGADVASAFAASACDAPIEREPQGEAVAFAANGAAYMTLSEGTNQPLYRFSVQR